MFPVSFVFSDGKCLTLMASSNWLQLKAPPISTVGSLVSIIDNEFITIVKDKGRDRYTLYKYKSFQNDWIDMHYQFPRDFRLDYYSMAYDGSNKMIYVCNRNKLVSLDLSIKIFKKLTTFNLNRNPQVIYENNKIHILRGFRQ